MSTVPERLKELCDRGGLKLAVAESASAGHTSATVASVSGSSSFFVGGVIAYDLDRKARLLGVNREHAASVNCVSERVAREMAEGVCVMFDADVGVAVTGYAEPSPSAGVETPFCWVGFSVGEHSWAERVEYDLVRPAAVVRVEAQRHFAWMATEGLTHYLAALAREGTPPEGADPDIVARLRG